MGVWLLAFSDYFTSACNDDDMKSLMIGKKDKDCFNILKKYKYIKANNEKKL